MDDASQRVTREDLLLFVNACFASTGQREFYADGQGEGISIEFLHRYILGNYRRLYARVLACGVNHMNQALIVQNLLASGRDATAEDRSEENRLITQALRALPTHRAMHLLAGLCARGVNNRRTRAITKAFLARPERVEFLAVKYRRAFRRSALHMHLPLSGELAPFLLRGWKERQFTTALFESFRQAHYKRAAIYDLPFSVAEGLAAKLGVPRAQFLARIDGRLTQNERLRLQGASDEALGESYDIDWSRQSPTRVASYVLSLAREQRKARRDELREALHRSAGRAARASGVRFGRVACVLDRSASSQGSSEKRRRPLAVALAVSALLQAASERVTVHWTPSDDEPDDLLVVPRGATDLVTPLLAALREQPDLLLVVSDGHDNDPPGCAGQVLAAAQRLFPACFMLHLNPVYDAGGFAPKRLCEQVPTIGIRDAEDTPTLVAFARFAHGTASLGELETHLEGRVRTFLGGSP
jgi:hypothetical protein